MSHKYLRVPSRPQAAGVRAKLLGAFALVLAGCGGGGGGPSTPEPTATPRATPTSSPVSGPLIVFQSDRDGDFEILQRQMDGSLLRLTDNANADTAPTPTRDWRIAFVSTRVGNQEIFVIGPASTVRVTNNSFVDNQPTWSPDERRLAFTSIRNDNSDIYIINADGSGERRLTRDPSSDVDPTFGPDGRIYFASDRAGSRHIFSMAADGSQVRQITQGDADDFSPAVSPDGRRLAFVSSRDGNLELYLLNLNQGMPQGAPLRLTRHAAADLDPAFTRDGRQILFASNRAGDFDIYRANLDGSGVQALVTGMATDRVPRAR